MNTILVCFIAAILMAVLPILLVFVLKNHQKTLKITTIVFAAIYFVCLFIGTTCDISITTSKTTIDFDYSNRWFDIDFLLYDFDFDNILINISMFFPLGFIVFVFAKKNQFAKTVILSLYLSLAIELIQFVLPINRYTELTDILFNVISGIISAAVCQFLLSKKAFKPATQTLHK